MRFGISRYLDFILLKIDSVHDRTDRVVSLYADHHCTDYLVDLFYNCDKDSNRLTFNIHLTNITLTLLVRCNKLIAVRFIELIRFRALYTSRNTAIVLECFIEPISFKHVSNMPLYI